MFALSSSALKPASDVIKSYFLFDNVFIVSLSVISPVPF